MPTPSYAYGDIYYLRNSLKYKLINTVYTVYMVNIKLGELEHNVNWWTFSLANRMVLTVDCLINTDNLRDY